MTCFRTLIFASAAAILLSCGAPEGKPGQNAGNAGTAAPFSQDAAALNPDTRSAIAADPDKAGNLYYIYDDSAEAPQTKPPRGYKPFYISHLGRHGARWGLLYQYDTIMNALNRAAKAGALNPRGVKFYHDFRTFYGEASPLEGELTGKGERQIRDIAARMYRRFPEVFRGDTRGTAIATTVPRVIMSMENTVEELHRCDPTLDIDASASVALLEILTPNISPLDFPRPVTVKELTAPAYDNYRSSVDLDEICSRLFSSTGTAVLDKLSFVAWLHAIKCSMQCLDSPADGIFDGIFTPEEDYLLARAYSFRVFSFLGNVKDSGTLWPAFSAYTLKDILDKADEDIAGGETDLRLRFTHDSSIIPMIVLMDIDGLGKETLGPEDSFELFPLYRMPMAGSLQFVFYRNRRGNVLVKVLFNEREARLPLEAESGPYYRWSDVRDHYGKVVEEALALIEAARNN